jgi:hypothetical protein
VIEAWEMSGFSFVYFVITKFRHFAGVTACTCSGRHEGVIDRLDSDAQAFRLELNGSERWTWSFI